MYRFIVKENKIYLRSYRTIFSTGYEKPYEDYRVYGVNKKPWMYCIVSGEKGYFNKRDTEKIKELSRRYL